MIAIKSAFFLFLIFHITVAWTTEESKAIYQTFDLSTRKTISAYFKEAQDSIKKEMTEAKKNPKAGTNTLKTKSKFDTEWASHTAFLNTPEILKDMEIKTGKKTDNIVFPINNYFDKILILQSWLKTSGQQSPFKNYCETYFQKIEVIIKESSIYPGKKNQKTQSKTEKTQSNTQKSQSNTQKTQSNTQKTQSKTQKTEKNKVIPQERFVKNNPTIVSDFLSSKIESKVVFEEDPIILTGKNSVYFNDVDIEDNQTADKEESEPISLKLQTLEVPEIVQSAGHKTTELVDLNESEVSSTKNDQNSSKLISLKNEEKKEVLTLKKVRKIIFVEILACENCKNDETLKKFLGQEN